MSVKTYVLLDHTRPTVPMYVRVNKDQRLRLDTRPYDHAYLQITGYFNKYARNRTLRLKLNSNSIFQDEQIEKEKMTANEKFTQQEKDSVMFRDGVLVTNNPIVQKFLDEHPQMEGFDGLCNDIKQPLFKSFDKSIEVKQKNSEFMQRLAAANKIASLGLKDGQDLMIRLNGNFFVPPDSLDEVQNRLIDFLDQADGAALNAILSEEKNVDDDVTILVSRVIAKGIISFEAIQDQVAKKVNGQWVGVKYIPSEYAKTERERHFKEFILSDAGKLLLDDLKKDISQPATIKPVMESFEDFEKVETKPIVENVIEEPVKEKRQYNKKKKRLYKYNKKATAEETTLENS